MMKTQLRKLLWIFPGVLILMGTAHYANAQDLSRMTTRDMLLKIRTMNVDQMSQIVRSMDRDTMTQIIQSMDSQTMTQIVRSLDPNTISEIAKRVLVEFAKARPKSVTAGANVPDAKRLPVGSSRIETAALPPAGPEQQNGTQDFQALEDSREEQIDLTGLTVLVHPSNPVSELTLEQIRKIYTGEYTNWNQAGGPDLAIKVMIVGEPTVGQAKLTSNATISAFSSSVFLGVAGTTGSLGFVPMMQTRQFRFIGAHNAVKTMAVRIDVPSQGTKTARTDSPTTVADLLLAYGR